MKTSSSMLLRTNALDIARTLGKDGSSMAASSTNFANARDIAASRGAPVAPVDVRAKRVDPSGLIRDKLIQAAVYDGFTSAQISVIPSEYDESPAEFLSSMRGLWAVPQLQTNDLNGSAVAAGGSATFTITPTTPGPVAVPGVRLEIGVGPNVTGIGQASVAINGRPTNLPPPAPAEALTSLATMVLAPVAGKICVARVLFGTPNIYGRRVRIPTGMSGPQPTLYTPGAPPALPSTAQAVAVGLQVTVSGIPDGTIVRAWPLIPGSPFFEADIAAIVGASL